MQFTSMPVWLFGSLAVLTAGVLALLHYLRVRPRRLRVITTLFWQQAAEQTRARTLFSRFRHPRTYLLLLAAALLVLLALARPVFNQDQQPHRVIVLEAGLAMTAADQRLDNALELVLAEAASLDEDRVAVIAADPQPRLLKHFDEGMVALQDRLGRVNAADTPVIREALLQTANSLLEGRENGEVILVSAQPVTTSDDKVRVLPAGDLIENGFILSTTFIPDSADPTHGSFQFRAGFTGKQTGEATATVHWGGNVLLEENFEFKPGDVKEFTLSGIAADGAVLSAAVAGEDAIAGDNRIDFQLPDRRRIHLVAENGTELPAAFASVLKSLPEVTTESAAGENLSVVRIGPVGSGAQILIQPAEGDGEMRPVRSSDHPLLDGLLFEDALCRAPASPMELTDGDQPLLMANGSTVATINADASQLAVSATIFEEDASLVRRTAYMAFWSRTLQHLAAWRTEPLTLSPIHAANSTDAVSDDLALKAGMQNFDLVAGASTAAPYHLDGAKIPAWQLILAAAVALMVLEAVLNIRGKIS